MLRQDDPKKCTAARMVRFGLATEVRRAGAGLVLDPFAARYLLPSDAGSDIVAVDCSWNRAGPAAYAGAGAGAGRRLPPLLAGNPTNYAKLGRLSTAEAAAAALFITGHAGRAREILSKFAWGHTFYELNCNLLDEYAAAASGEHVGQIALDYGLARSRR